MKKGLFAGLKQLLSRNEAPDSHNTTEQPPKQGAKPAPVLQTARKSFQIPEKVGDCLKIYQYLDLCVEPSENAIWIAEKMQDEDRWTFDVRNEDGTIKLYYGNDFFGSLLQKTDMVSDWIKREDPLIVGLKNINDENGVICTAFAVFYRDEQKRLAKRENEVVRLVKYASSDVQNSVLFTDPGEKLELEEDWEKDDAVKVIAGSEIGWLPKKQAVRFLNEGCAGAFFDHSDYDDEKDKYIPYIKIFW